MRTANFACMPLVLLITFSALAFPDRNDTVDPITGEWNVVFLVQNSRTPAIFSLTRHGNLVTGTVNSDHTGPGVIRDGEWKDGKLSFTVDFKTHQSIAIAGTLIEGKLIGEFRTEGFVAKWEGVKRIATKD
jgi:hypothetical protein